MNKADLWAALSAHKEGLLVMRGLKLVFEHDAAFEERKPEDEENDKICEQGDAKDNDDDTEEEDYNEDDDYSCKLGYATDTDDNPEEES